MFTEAGSRVNVLPVRDKKGRAMTTHRGGATVARSNSRLKHQKTWTFMSAIALFAQNWAIYT